MADKVWEDSSKERKVNCCCIANAEGICRVKDCHGEIQRWGWSLADTYEAAERYTVLWENYFSSRE